jgi:hypothetical protein
MSFDKVSLAKKAVSLIVGAGTGKIVATIIKNNISPEKAIDKITMTAAAWALGGVVAEMTERYTDTKIDEAFEAWNKLKNYINKNTETEDE